MNLEFEFSYQANLKEGLPVGAGPYGNRLVVEVTGGRVEGKRLRGKILSGGGDWLLVGPDGWARLDVRAQFVTDDGAAIYVSYFGILEMTLHDGSYDYRFVSTRPTGGCTRSPASATWPAPDTI